MNYKEDYFDLIFEKHFSFSRLKSFFEYTDSDELILLKGHLLIEEVIDWRLCQVIEKKNYKDLNLNFYRKVVLLYSICRINKNDDLIKNILKINEIRNLYAHKLETNIKEEVIELLFQYYEKELPKTIKRKQTYLNSLRKLFYSILGQLYGQAIIEEYEKKLP